MAAQLQGLARRREETGRAAGSDPIARQQRVKMRNVPVLPLGRFEIPVVEPFLELSGFADPHWRQTSLRRGETPREIVIDVQNLRGLHTLAEQIANDLSVHRWSGADRDVGRMFVLG